jgi:hypothetical protein
MYFDVWNGIWNGTEHVYHTSTSYYFRAAKDAQHNLPIAPLLCRDCCLFSDYIAFLFSGVFLFFNIFYILILLFAHAVEEATIVGVLLGLMALGCLTLFLTSYCCHKKKPQVRSNDIEQATETSIELEKNPMKNSSD